MLVGPFWTRLLSSCASRKRHTQNGYSFRFYTTLLTSVPARRSGSRRACGMQLGIFPYVSPLGHHVAQSCYPTHIGDARAPRTVGHPTARAQRRSAQGPPAQDARTIRTLARCTDLLQTSVRAPQSFSGSHPPIGKNAGSVDPRPNVESNRFGMLWELGQWGCGHEFALRTMYL